MASFCSRNMQQTHALFVGLVLLAALRDVRAVFPVHAPAVLHTPFECFVVQF